MLGYKRIVIAQHERGLYLKDRTIRKVLEPGVYRYYDLFDRIKIEVYALTVPEFEHAYTDVLLKEWAELCEQYFQVVELGEYQVGLVYKNGTFTGIQRPAIRKLYWKGPIEVKVEVLDVKEDYALPRSKVGLIAHARANSLPTDVINSVYFSEVADNHLGLLIVDGELIKTLTPGLYAYWKFNRKVTVEQVDLRLQAMEVQGQEILTKDKVTLRVDLSAHYKVTDVVQARSDLTHFSDHLYRELQFALRQAVGARTLDTLLGNKRIADAVAETRMARSFKDDEFWLGVLRFFIANPMLDTQIYGPIVDYIRHKKYENRMVFIERGVAREEGPEQPNFSMHGRTPGTLLRQVEGWHRRLGRESRGGNLNWVKSSFSDFHYREGQANSRNMKVWTIRELLNSSELVTEGRAQSHCVATYARSCFTGATSIWTMDLQETQARQKIVTIELHNRSKTICQVRGLRNRKATDREMDVIRRWADMEGLTVAGYL